MNRDTLHTRGRRASLLLAAALMSVAALVVPEVHAQVNEQNAAYQDVQDGTIKPFPSLRQAADAQVNGELLGTEYIREPARGQYVYRFTYRSAETGRQVQVDVDARTAKVIGVAGR